MPWQPLPRIAFAIATYPFPASSPADLPLEIGDELYIIEESADGNWLRGYLVAPPSLLAGLTSVKGQTLEARVFSGVFPRSCVEIREVLGENDETDDNDSDDGGTGSFELQRTGSDSAKSGLAPAEKKRRKDKQRAPDLKAGRKSFRQGEGPRLSLPVTRDPLAPRPPAPVPMLKIGDETPTSASEPLIDEIASCLREWHSTNLHQLLLSRQYGKLDKLSQLITTLNMSRQQFLHNVLTAWEYNRLREKTVWDLVRVNKLCGVEVIVRDPGKRGRVLTGDDSVVQVTRLQSVMSLLEEAPAPSTEPIAIHHLLVDIKGMAGASTESTTLVLFLATKAAGGILTPLSESYIVEVPAGGEMGEIPKEGQMRTLFTDLTAAEIGGTGGIGSRKLEVYLVFKIRAHEHVLVTKPNSRSHSAGQGTLQFPKESHKAPPSSGNKSVRRSLMWTGKNTRQAISRGNPKLDLLPEQPEEKVPASGGPESGEGMPPSTAGSKGTRSSSDGRIRGQATQVMADRTMGVGSLKLNSIMKQDEEVEQVVNIWTPSSQFATDKAEEGGDWDPIIAGILDSKSGRYEKSRRAERVQVHLRPFNHPDADMLIKSTPTVLSGVCKSNRMGFAGAPTKARSDFFLTMDQALVNRQCLLSRYGSPPSAIPSSVQGNSLQVTLEVRAASGHRIENCIYPSSNSGPVSVWKSVTTDKGEAWRQTVRLFLPPEDVYSTHVVLYLADLPNPPFALAYMPLWDQQALIGDGSHTLILYKLDETVAFAQSQGPGKGGYLSLPFTPRGKGEHSADVTGPLASLKVSTYLCSTKFSQDRVVLALLRWRESKREEIPDLLKQFIFVPEIEIVKLLNDVFDGLFSILVEFAGKDELEDLVFTALVRVLDLVHDRRFDLAPLVDQYAEKKFNYPFATPCLVSSFTRLLSRPKEAETARKLRATFKVVRHILKFITHARGQQKEKEAGIGITTSTPGFSRQLRTIFKALDAMMESTAPVLVGNQTLAVQHFHTWLPELAGLLTREEILHIAIDFMDSCALVKGKLVLYKLILVINYTKLDIFSQPEQRSALSTNTVRWISPHWGSTEVVTDQWKDQVRLCCSVLASQVEHLGPEIADYIPKLLRSYLSIQAAEKKPRKQLSFLFPTSYPFPARSTSEEVVLDEALVELSAVLSALSTSPSGMQLELADDDLGLLVENFLRVHMSILQGEAFPPSWLSVYIFHHKSSMRILQYLASILLETFLPHPDEAETFNTELWKLFFSTMLKLVGSPSLALETFPEQKRRAVWKIAGDVREHGADLLRRTWEAIGWETSADERIKYGLSKMGGYQVQYVPTLVGPIVELCLSVHEGLRGMAVEVLQTMIVSEWTLNEDVSVIQTEMFDCLDAYLKSKPLTESIMQRLFVSELLQRFAGLAVLPGEPLYVAVRELIGNVDEFLELLVAVHSGEGAGEVSHLVDRLRLMEFLRDMKKEEIFVRYVNQLAKLQAEVRNHAEAGLALRLHADLYSWDPLRDAPAMQEPFYPAESHFERKERIYLDMIRHFEDGEAWTSALDAYKELKVQYETNVFDFAKLARTERAMATVYESLSKSDKLVPKYFKVTFKGLGFPANLRDKEFVFSGTPTERTSAFTDRIQEQYPSAQIVSSDRLNDLEGQFLLISSLSPHRDLNHPAYQRSRVPQLIRDYLVSSHPQTFSVSTKRDTSGPVTEHYSEKIVYTTAEPFPTILRRSEIVSAHEFRLSAKETALERIVRKTAEMTTIERSLAEDDGKGDGKGEDAQLLLDAVRISVNAHSENSVVRYRGLLPQMMSRSSSGMGEMSDEDDEGDEPCGRPELDRQENAIKMALVDHAIMIQTCLTTFSKSSIEILRRHVEELERTFESTFAPEIAILTPIQPLRELDVSTSPTWSNQNAPPSAPMQADKSNGASTTVNGNGVGEEMTVVQPAAVRQSKGARLRFLGGRKKDADKSDPDPRWDKETAIQHVDGGADKNRSYSRAFSLDYSPRRSLFALATSEKRPSVTNGTELSGAFSGSEWVTDLGPRESTETAPAPGEKYQALTESSSGQLSVGNVKRRLSMFALGKKRSRVNGLISLDEE